MEQCEYERDEGGDGTGGRMVDARERKREKMKRKVGREIRK